jgi:hypothetical protein
MMQAVVDACTHLLVGRRVKEVAELLWSKELLVVWACFEVALGDVDDVVNARADLCATQGRRE